MAIIRRGELPEQAVGAAFSGGRGQVIQGDHIQVSLLHFRAHDGAQPHQHPEEQVSVILSGRLRVTIEGVTADLGPGDAFHAPAGVVHSADPLEDAEVLACKNVVSA
jgi:quercetin dioxygenase-like cupin family protein